MYEFWVVDTKCKVALSSPIPQDGSEYYFGRSVVPAESKDQAIEVLTEYLKRDGIDVEQTLSVIRYEDGSWSDDDDYDVKASFQDALERNEIALGCFISSKSKNEI